MMNKDQRYIEIVNGINTLINPGDLFELRIIGGKIAGGYYTDAEKAANDVINYQGPPGSNFFITINPVNPPLLSRAANRIKYKLTAADPTTSDSDIVRRRWLPIDIDPKRPSGISASDKEKEAAIKKAGHIRDYLTGMGFPEPVIADSGNGMHLLYRIDLENTKETTELVRSFLLALSKLFSDERVDIDTSVSNAARIMKLYGTVAKKGDSTEERPHRDSKILSVPDNPVIVEEDLVQFISTILKTPEEKPGEKSAEKPDGDELLTWLSENGIGISSYKSFHGGILYKLDKCPFSDDHRDGAYAIRFPNGKIFLGCHHNRCGAGKNRWNEVTGGVSEKPARHKEKKNLIAKETEEKAMEILKNNPMDFFLETFALRHIGDQTLAKTLILSIASKMIKETNGLHVIVSGPSGKGKSDVMKTMLKMVPKESSLKGKFSAKALYYADDIEPGQILLLDDTVFNEDIQSLIKDSTTNFTEPTYHRSVDHMRRPITLSIPERCVWWITNVTTNTDDQVLNRMLNVWVDDSSDQDFAVYQRKLLARSGKRLNEAAFTLAKAVWQQLFNEGVIDVMIPYCTSIRIDNPENRRNVDIILDLIMAHAILNRYNRAVEVDEDGCKVLVATVEDFEVAQDIYNELNGRIGSQTSKLTHDEAFFLDLLREMKVESFCYQDMQRWTGWNYGRCRRVICGYKGQSDLQSGCLLDKVSGISEISLSKVVTHKDGSEQRHSYRAFLVDYDILSVNHSGDVSLDLPDGPDSPVVTSSLLDDDNKIIGVNDDIIEDEACTMPEKTVSDLIVTNSEGIIDKDVLNSNQSSVPHIWKNCDNEIIKLKNNYNMGIYSENKKELIDLLIDNATRKLKKTGVNKAVHSLYTGGSDKVVNKESLGLDAFMNPKSL